MRLLLLATITLAAVLPSQGLAAGYRVFILHSYELEHVCGYPQHKGVIAALEHAGFIEGDNLTIATYAMDTKRTNNTPALIEHQAVIAIRKIQRFSPDVLVTLDDNAFRTAGLTLGRQGTKVVFCGLNTKPEHYDEKKEWMHSRFRPGGTITGVIEKLHFLSALSVQKQILKNLTRFRVFSDNSPTGSAALEQIRDEMRSRPHPFEWDVRITDSWEQYQQDIIETCNTPDIDTIYPVALLLTDKDGKTYTAPEILRWTTNHCSIPAIPVNYAFVKLGLMGGAGVDFEHMGYQAGRMVSRILKGESPATIPIEEASRYALVFNLKRAAELGITIPEDILLSADEVYPHR